MGYPYLPYKLVGAIGICLVWKFMLLHLFEFISSCISSIFLSEISFSSNQMVNTRSGGGQDIPPDVRAHIVNQ
jgi:hypothetical protein